MTANKLTGDNGIKDSSKIDTIHTKSAGSEIISDVSEQTTNIIYSDKLGEDALIQKLIKDFVEAVECKSLQVDYDYQDYSNRIQVDPNIFIKTQQEILRQSPIKEAWDAIIRYNDNKWDKYIFDKILETYLKDLVYSSLQISQKSGGTGGQKKFSSDLNHESIESLERHFSDASHWRLAYLHKAVNIQACTNEQLEVIFRHSNKWKEVIFQNINFHECSLHQLKIIFGSSMQGKYISFSNTYLDKCTNEQLEIIFGNTGGLVGISFKDDFHRYTNEQLEIIFRHAKNWKQVSLDQNNLGECSNNQLEIIFQNSRQWKITDLSLTPISQYTLDQLKIIFWNSDGWKSVCFSDIENCTIDQLDIIFHNSKLWKIVNLDTGRISRCSEDQLGIIFKDAQNWKVVSLSDTDQCTTDQLEIIFQRVANWNKGHFLPSPSGFRNRTAYFKGEKKRFIQSLFDQQESKCDINWDFE